VYKKEEEKSQEGASKPSGPKLFTDLILIFRQNSLSDPRCMRLATLYKCEMQASDSYSDWAALYLTPGTLVMSASTYAYFPALIGNAKEVHYPAVGFFHDKHNVCMRERKADSHLGQMRLPFGRSLAASGGGFSDRKVVYHDIYSRQFFLTYDELQAAFHDVPCDAILNQHVCDANGKPLPYRESRYCYHQTNATSKAMVSHAVQTAREKGEGAVRRAASASVGSRRPPSRHEKLRAAG
jgi:hypothetical protein